MTEPPIHYRLLREHILKAINAQEKQLVRDAVAVCMDDPKRHRFRSVWDLSEDGTQVDLNSLSYEVEVLVSDGWATLCTVHWTNLGLEWADVQWEFEENRRQWGEGTYPGGPNDPHQRGE
jgi:hypothetical protein